MRRVSKNRNLLIITSQLAEPIQAGVSNDQIKEMEAFIGLILKGRMVCQKSLDQLPVGKFTDAVNRQTGEMLQHEFIASTINPYWEALI